MERLGIRQGEEKAAQGQLYPAMMTCNGYEIAFPSAPAEIPVAIAVASDASGIPNPKVRRRPQDNRGGRRICVLVSVHSFLSHCN